MSETTSHVMIHGDSFFYKDKAPFVQSGKSVLGGLEYDPDTDMVKCHECGELQQHLGLHVYAVHGILARDYKRKHGLSLQSSLVGEKTRRALQVAALKYQQTLSPAEKEKRKRIMKKAVRASVAAIKKNGKASAETMNENMACHAQVIARVRALAERLGRPPIEADLAKDGMSRGSLRLKFGCLTNLLQLAGVGRRDNVGVKPGTHRKYSDQQLLQYLRKFRARFHRMPRGSDFRRGFMPSQPTYQCRFGSVSNAWRQI